MREQFEYFYSLIDRTYTFCKFEVRWTRQWQWKKVWYYLLIESPPQNQPTPSFWPCPVHLPTIHSAIFDSLCYSTVIGRSVTVCVCHPVITIHLNIYLWLFACTQWWSLIIIIVVERFSCLFLTFCIFAWTKTKFVCFFLCSFLYSHVKCHCMNMFLEVIIVIMKQRYFWPMVMVIVLIIMDLVITIPIIIIPVVLTMVTTYYPWLIPSLNHNRGHHLHHF